MILVKRDDEQKISESYEVFALNIDFDKKTINASMTHYRIQDNGIPIANDSIFVLFDGKDYETSMISKKLPTAKRNSDGAIIFDDKGNPIIENILMDVPESKEVMVSSFSEVINSSSTGTIMNSLKKGVLQAFQKYKLKDSRFRIEE